MAGKDEFPQIQKQLVLNVKEDDFVCIISDLTELLLPLKLDKNKMFRKIWEAKLEKVLACKSDVAALLVKIVESFQKMREGLQQAEQRRAAAEAELPKLTEEIWRLQEEARKSRDDAESKEKQHVLKIEVLKREFSEKVTAMELEKSKIMEELQATRKRLEDTFDLNLNQASHVAELNSRLVEEAEAHGKTKSELDSVRVAQRLSLSLTKFKGLESLQGLDKPNRFRLLLFSASSRIFGFLDAHSLKALALIDTSTYRNPRFSSSLTKEVYSRTVEKLKAELKTTNSRLTYFQTLADRFHDEPKKFAVYKLLLKRDQPNTLQVFENRMIEIVESVLACSLQNPDAIFLAEKPETTSFVSRLRDKFSRIKNDPKDTLMFFRKYMPAKEQSSAEIEAAHAAHFHLFTRLNIFSKAVEFEDYVVHGIDQAKIDNYVSSLAEVMSKKQPSSTDLISFVRDLISCAIGVYTDYKDAVILRALLAAELEKVVNEKAEAEAALDTLTERNRVIEKVRVFCTEKLAVSEKTIHEQTIKLIKRKNEKRRLKEKLVETEKQMNDAQEQVRKFNDSAKKSAEELNALRSKTETAAMEKKKLEQKLAAVSGFIAQVIK